MHKCNNACSTCVTKRVGGWEEKCEVVNASDLLLLVNGVDYADKRWANDDDDAATRAMQI